MDGEDTRVYGDFIEEMWDEYRTDYGALWEEEAATLYFLGRQ